MIRFRVRALPVTQGSMKAFVPKGWTRPIVTHDNPKALSVWRDLIALEARRAHTGGVLDGPLSLTIRFHLPKPRSMPAELRTEKQRWFWTWPWRKPDLSKLERAAEDALKGVLLRDDAQICRVLKEKIFSDEPGVEIQIEQLIAAPERQMVLV